MEVSCLQRQKKITRKRSVYLQMKQQATIILTWRLLLKDCLSFIPSNAKVLDLPQKKDIKNRNNFIKQWIEQHEHHDNIAVILTDKDVLIFNASGMVKLIRKLLSCQFDVNVVFLTFQSVDQLLDTRKSKVSYKTLYEKFSLRRIGNFFKSPKDLLAKSTEQHYNQFERFAVAFTRSPGHVKNNLKVFSTTFNKR